MQRHAQLNLYGVVAGVHLPKDGQGDPANIALALSEDTPCRSPRGM